MTNPPSISAGESRSDVIICPPDIVYQAAILAVLVWGLIVTTRARSYKANDIFDVDIKEVI